MTLFAKVLFAPSFFFWYKLDCKSQQWKMHPEAPEAAKSIMVWSVNDKISIQKEEKINR